MSNIIKGLIENTNMEKEYNSTELALMGLIALDAFPKKPHRDPEIRLMQYIREGFPEEAITDDDPKIRRLALAYHWVKSGDYQASSEVALLFYNSVESPKRKEIARIAGFRGKFVYSTNGVSIRYPCGYSTLQTAAKFTGLKPKTLRQMIKDGKLKFSDSVIHGVTMIRNEHLVDLIK